MSHARPLPKVVYLATARPKQKKKRRLGTLILVVLVTLYLGYTFAAQEYALVRLRAREAELIAERSAVEAEGSQLQAAIERLNTPEYIERLARQRLGLLRPQDGILLPVIVRPGR